jgi:cysteine desulfurase / selenocysteine lyase
MPRPAPSLLATIDPAPTAEEAAVIAAVIEAMWPKHHVAAARQATPGSSDITHLNNAGAALPTERTLDTVIDHLRLEARVGGYEAAALRAGELAAVRASAARLLNAHEDDVALTTSDSNGFTRALWGFVLNGGVGAGATVLVDRIAYNSHYLALLQLRRIVGFTIAVLPSREDGGVEESALDDAVGRPGVALVMATIIGTHCGLVNPVEEIGAVCRQAGVPYAVDACQAVGQLPVDVEAIGCDVLSGTGRKFLRAPRGTGLLYVRRSMAERIDPPGIDGSSADWVDADHYELAPGARRFEEFETSVAARLGLGAAIDQALELGLDAIASRLDALAGRLRGALVDVPGLRLLDGAGRTSAIVTCTVAGRRAAEIVAAARDAGININASTAPWARLDMAAKHVDEVVRVSPHYYNTESEIDDVAALITSFA